MMDAEGSSPGSAICIHPFDFALAPTPALARNTGGGSRARAAFTIIEMLVVIGIIIVLAALLLPMIARVHKSGQRTIVASQFQVIGSGLEAYKMQFGDYPRPDPGSRDTGFALLTKALVGPYGDGVIPAATPTLDNQDPPVFIGKEYKAGDAVRQPGSLPTPGQPSNTWVALRTTTSTPAAGNADWVQFDVNDLADGPGTLIRAGGRPIGPILQAGKVRLRGMAILDAWDNPILYFPADLGKPNVQMQNAYVAAPHLNPSKPLINADDNFEIFRRTGETDQVVLRRIQQMLGDYNADGRVDPPTAAQQTDQQIARPPFLLWSAGPDGFFGPNGDVTDPREAFNRTQKCDDVIIGK